jgi:hypothetical protein
MQQHQTILMPAAPPTGHRIRLLLRSAAGLGLLAVPVAVAAAVAILAMLFA